MAKRKSGEGGIAKSIAKSIAVRSRRSAGVHADGSGKPRFEVFEVGLFATGSEASAAVEEEKARHSDAWTVDDDRDPVGRYEKAILVHSPGKVVTDGEVEGEGPAAPAPRRKR